MRYKPYSLVELRDELVLDESEERYPYTDTVGKVTIGIGWNLTDHGLPSKIVRRLFVIAVDRAEEDLDQLHSPWRALSFDRQRVLLNMAFNLGRTRLAEFKKMWAALDAGDHATAAAEMLDSRWARQVGVRATRLARRMREGA